MTNPNQPGPYQQWQQPQQPGQQYPGYQQPPIYPPTGHGGQQPPQAQPPKKRKKWPWIVGGIFAFIVLVSAINGGGGGNTATVAGETIPVAPAAPAAPAPAQPAVQAPAPAPEPPPTPIVFEGKGDDVVTLEKPAGVAVLDFECPRCSGNTVLQTDGREALLVNEIGGYKGRHLIDIADTGRTGTLTVTAKGSWKITVTPGLSVLRKSGGEPISGKGDDVVLVASSTTKAAITNRGESNFVVQVVGEYLSDLAINEIGSYEGTVPLRGPAVAIVTSSGDWTITPS